MPYLTPDSPPESYRFRTLRIPDTPEFLALVSGALASLLFESNWQPFGTATVEETSQLFKKMFLEYLQGTSFMIGQIVHYTRDVLPENVLPCDGSTYDRVDYPELYAVLPTELIIDADEFMTPDLRGIALIGEGTSSLSGTNFALTDIAGSEEHTLTVGEMPSHSHTTDSLTDISVVSPGDFVAALKVPLISGFTGDTGGGNPHNNMQPSAAYLVGVIAK